MGDGVPCHFRAAGRCGIYEHRPDVCRQFSCGWQMDGSRFPSHWRPDKVGFLIQPGAWDGGKCWLVRPAGRDPGEEELAVMRQYTKETGEPHIIVRNKSWLCYGKAEFRKAMVESAKSENAGVEFRINFLPEP